MANEQLITDLTILSNHQKNIGQRWKHAAYQQAIASIKQYNQPITIISQLKGMKGIGKSIRPKIQQFIDTGQIKQVEDIRSKIHVSNVQDDTIDILKQVWGIGHIKANELWNQGIRSIKELHKHQNILTRQQQVGLKYYTDFLKPIPRKYIDLLQIAIRFALNREYGPKTYQFVVTGSYRRGQQTSGDIDCVTTSTLFDLKSMIHTLEDYGIVIDTLSLKNQQFRGVAICPNTDQQDNQYFPIRLDIVFVPEENLGATLLYFTGSVALNILLRNEAKKKGWKLTQHGLTIRKTGARIPVYTEKEIFNELGFDFVKPENR